MQQSLATVRIEEVERQIDELAGQLVSLSPHQQARALQRLRIKLDLL